MTREPEKEEGERRKKKKKSLEVLSPPSTAKRNMKGVKKMGN